MRTSQTSTATYRRCIEFPGGKTLGDTKNIKMHFDPSNTKLAVEGKL